MNKTKAHLKCKKDKEKYPVINRMIGRLNEILSPKIVFILSAEREDIPTERLKAVQITPYITSGMPDIFK